LFILEVMAELSELKPKDRVSSIKDQLEDAEQVYKSSDIDPEAWKKFYLGANHWDDIKPDGDLQITIPLASVCLDQHVFLFSNIPPRINLKAPSGSATKRLLAQIGENLSNLILYDSEFPILFQEATMAMAQEGDVYLYPYWDAEDKRRSKKGTAKLTYLTPGRIRLIHGDGYRFKPTGFVILDRLSPAAIKRIYGFEDAQPDSEYSFLDTKNLMVKDDGKTTVYSFLDHNIFSVVVNGKEAKYGTHGYGFVPVRQVRQAPLPDNITSLPLLFHADSMQKYFNYMLSAAFELALDVAFPPMLEINNALGKKKIKKWRRKKIKIKISGQGEGLKYLGPAGDPATLMKMISTCIDLLYLLTQMPPAAMGVLPSTITSGYQAKVAQQPALTKGGSWGLQWAVGLQDTVSKLLKLVKVKDPKSLKIELETGEKVDISEVVDYQVSVLPQFATPIDEVRKTQMTILRLQNNLISVYQALEALGDEDPFKTMEMIRSEITDPELNPEKAQRVATAKAALKQFAGQMPGMVKALGGTAQMGGQQRSPEEMQRMMDMANQTNALRGAAGRRPEEQRPYPTGGKERLAGESTAPALPPLPGEMETEER